MQTFLSFFRVALCQIATHETAYLLDMTALWVPETKDIVKSFFQQLLQSEDILKLGEDADKFLRLC